MTLQPLHSEFPYIWGKFDFLFYQCTQRSKHIPSLIPPFPSFECVRVQCSTNIEELRVSHNLRFSIETMAMGLLYVSYNTYVPKMIQDNQPSLFPIPLPPPR
jgi:hypothetical protein